MVIQTPPTLVAPPSAEAQPWAPCVLSAEEWAAQTYLPVDLGDSRRNRRVVQLAAQMAGQPDASLPAQTGSRAALVASYRLLNNPQVTMAALLAPHRQQTLAAASQVAVVLLVEDTSELDYTRHAATKGLGPVGNERGRGLLLHSTLAVEPARRLVLGLAHAQVVVREPLVQPAPHRRHTPEGAVWQTSATSVGAPPAGVLWVHVSDRDSDVFAYMATCVDLGKHFLVRAYQNRTLLWDAALVPDRGEAIPHLLDYARSLPPQANGGYMVAVAARPPQPAHDGQPARPAQPAREAQVVLQWTRVQIGASAHSHATPEMRKHAPLVLWLLRVWEPAPPPDVEPVEWILLSSLPITTIAEAQRAAAWYSCRWLCEDYHQCLKTGCQIERSQLDAEADLERLLGFCCPLAVRLLQVRQTARQQPDLPASTVVPPLMVEVLSLRRPALPRDMTIGVFWQAVAGLGGHLGRKGDGPPGWRTLWRGWRKLTDLTEGAGLVRANTS